MKIKFVPSNIEVEIKPSQSVLDVANEHGIYIKSVCRGVPSCAECRIKILDGDYNVFPPGPKELALIGTAYFVDQRRLSCQLKCFGEITVDLTEQIEKEAQVVKRPRGGRKEGDSVARTGNIMLEKEKEPEINEDMIRYDQKIRKAEQIFFKENQKREIARLKSKKTDDSDDAE